MAYIGGFIGRNGKGGTELPAGAYGTRSGRGTLFSGGVPICEKRVTAAIKGYLTNAKELAAQLGLVGVPTDAEIIAEAYERFGRYCAGRLEGSFAAAVWDKEKDELLLITDRMGTTDIFYAETADGFLFSTDAAKILKNPHFRAIIDREALHDLIMFSPACPPGKTPVKRLYTLRGAHTLRYREKPAAERYWQMSYREPCGIVEDTASDILFLLETSVKNTVKRFPRAGLMLSGGLDSSLIAAAAKKHMPHPKTFSVHMEGNEKYFVPGDYQPESDDEYSREMAAYIGGEHREINISPDDLAENLHGSMLARGFPGMGDVDSSLLSFLKKAKETHTYALMGGECADELFGGYPWFSRVIPDSLPWGGDRDFRLSLLAPELRRGEEAGEYAESLIKKIADETPMKDMTPAEARLQRLYYLCLQWFAPVLLSRNIRLAACEDMELLSPFADSALLNYAFSIPWDMKFLYGREKGILRKAAEGLIPPVIAMRKKSPFPKSYHKRYEEIIFGLLRETMASSPKMQEIFSSEAVSGLAETDETERPFFGQLMKKPQTAAWLCQTAMWLDEFGIEIEL